MRCAAYSRAATTTATSTVTRSRCSSARSRCRRTRPRSSAPPISLSRSRHCWPSRSRTTSHAARRCAGERCCTTPPSRSPAPCAPTVVSRFSTTTRAAPSSRARCWSACASASACAPTSPRSCATICGSVSSCTSPGDRSRGAPCSIICRRPRPSRSTSRSCPSPIVSPPAAIARPRRSTRICAWPARCSPTRCAGARTDRPRRCGVATSWRVRWRSPPVRGSARSCASSPPPSTRARSRTREQALAHARRLLEIGTV